MCVLLDREMKPEDESLYYDLNLGCAICPKKFENSVHLTFDFTNLEQC